jgi:hypothetical protein
MPLTIFYSWQSDTPNSTNRGFIEDAIVKAIKAISDKIEIQNALRDEEIKIDKDTQGVPGTPPIVETIFNKIDNCTIFIPDLTFVGKSPEGRMLPNPNVLIEYGWALKSISYSRIIPVMNTAFGEPTSENLPFNMRHLRNPITYRVQTESKEVEKISAKNKLIKVLTVAIETILQSGVVEALLPASHAIEEFTYDNPAFFVSATEPLATINVGNGTDVKIFVPNAECLFLRLIPVNQIDAIKSVKKAYELVSSGQLMLMGRNHFDGYRFIERNRQGAVVCGYEDDKAVRLTQLFLSNQIWGIDLDIINKAKQMAFNLKHGIANVAYGYFPSKAIEEIFNSTLENYLKFATNQLGLSTPLKYIAGAAGVKDYRMTVGVSGLIDFGGRVIKENIVYEGLITDYKQKTTEILRPLFNHIWQECNLDRPDVEVLR